jgi:hypothetical protein
MSTFTAQYHGTCEECTGPIVPGQEAAYNARDDLVHLECPPPELELAPTERSCPRCFLVHAGECF